MRRLPFLAFCLLANLCWGQSELLKADTLWIHRKPVGAEEDMDDYFPEIRSQTSKEIADNINAVLQMEVLGYTLTPAHLNKLMEPVASPMARSNYNFSFTRMSGDLTAVEVGTYVFNNTMSLNGYYRKQQFLFDASTGDVINLRWLFLGPGYDSLLKNISSGFRENFYEVMNKYFAGFDARGEAQLEADCECNCSEHIDDSGCADQVRMDWDPDAKMFTFRMDDCEWSNPRQHEEYQATLSAQRVAPWFSHVGWMLFDAYKAVDIPEVFSLWRGTIGDKLPVTFRLHPAGCELRWGTGAEVYDRYGTNIPLSYQIGDNPSTILISEMSDDQQTTLATITASIAATGNTLTGNWVKADGSKTLPFSAHLASNGLLRSTQPRADANAFHFRLSRLFSEAHGLEYSFLIALSEYDSSLHVANYKMVNDTFVDAENYPGCKPGNLIMLHMDESRSMVDQSEMRIYYIDEVDNGYEVWDNPIIESFDEWEASNSSAELVLDYAIDDGCKVLAVKSHLERSIPVAMEKDVITFYSWSAIDHIFKVLLNLTLHSSVTSPDEKGKLKTETEDRTFSFVKSSKMPYDVMIDLVKNGKKSKERYTWTGTSWSLSR